MILRLSAALAEEAAAHARSAYPDECCGLLLGPVPASFGEPGCALEPDALRRLANSWEPSARGRRYEMDPLELARVERELSGSGRGVLGIYHSHPDAPAWPSPFDLERAWPSYAYWILSARAGGRIAESRVWRLTPDGRSFAEGRFETIEPREPGPSPREQGVHPWR